MLYLWLCLASGLWLIHKDQNNNFDFLSAFTWNLSSLLIIIVLPGIIENTYGFCLYGLQNRCSEEATSFSGRILLIQILSFGSSYFIFKNIKRNSSLNLASLTIKNHKIVYVLAGCYFIAFLDLLYAWLPSSSWGGLYENMKGHGWANHITFPLGTILGILLISTPRHRKLGAALLFCQIVYTILFMDRKTQVIQILFCISWVLFYDYRNTYLYKKLSKILVCGLWAICLLMLFALILENNQWYSLHQLVHKLRIYWSYNIGHFYILNLSYQNMPVDFSLSPLIFSRSIPYYAYIPKLAEWSVLNDSIIEQWIYGSKISASGGFPFLSIFKQYLSLGYSGVFIFALIWGIIFSQISNHSIKSMLHPNNISIYPGIFALFWTYFLNLGIPSLQFPLQLAIITTLICFPFSSIIKKIKPSFSKQKNDDKDFQRE